MTSLFQYIRNYFNRKPAVLPNPTLTQIRYANNSLSYLRKLRANGYFTMYGLCETAKLNCLQKELRHDMFRTWKHFSGDIRHPVSCAFGATPKDEYYRALNKCDPETVYGRRRIALANHCIRYLESYQKLRS